jgi:thiol-disulfide isomerase/thioredoxin
MTGRVLLFALLATLLLVAACSCSQRPGQAGDDQREKPGPAQPGDHRPVATVRLTAADNTTFAIADLPGQAKVINVWATWCKPCIQEMPLLNEVAAAYRDKGVTFVALSIDENGAQDVEPVLKSGRVKIDLKLAYASLESLEPLGITAPIPDTLVFDGQNREIAHIDKVIERKELEEAIERALASK